jgi:hypothetical protein
MYERMTMHARQVARLAAGPEGIEADRDVLAAIGIDLDEVRARASRPRSGR